MYVVAGGMAPWGSMGLSQRGLLVGAKQAPPYRADLVDERHGRRGRRQPAFLIDAACHPANRTCTAFTPPLRQLRNGAWPRWRAEETLRNGACEARICFLNRRADRNYLRLLRRRVCQLLRHIPALRRQDDIPYLCYPLSPRKVQYRIAILSCTL